MLLRLFTLFLIAAPYTAALVSSPEPRSGSNYRLNWPGLRGLLTPNVLFDFISLRVINIRLTFNTRRIDSYNNFSVVRYVFYAVYSNKFFTIRKSIYIYIYIKKIMPAFSAYSNCGPLQKESCPTSQSSFILFRPCKCSEPLVWPIQDHGSNKSDHSLTARSSNQALHSMLYEVQNC